MKTELKTVGNTELNRLELTEILREWLRERHSLDLNKAVYEVKGNTVNGVKMEVSKNEVVQPEERKEMVQVNPVTRPVRLKKHQRVNMGIFDFLRGYFAQSKGHGTKTIRFEHVYERVKEKFPLMTQKRLQLYLYDRKQIPGILSFSKIDGVVHLQE